MIKRIYDTFKADAKRMAEIEARDRKVRAVQAHVKESLEQGMVALSLGPDCMDNIIDALEMSLQNAVSEDDLIGKGYRNSTLDIAVTLGYMKVQRAKLADSKE